MKHTYNLPRLRTQSAALVEQYNKSSAYVVDCKTAPFPLATWYGTQKDLDFNTKYFFGRPFLVVYVLHPMERML